MGLPEDPIGADAVHLPLTTGLSDLRSQLSTPVNGVVRQSTEKKITLQSVVWNSKNMPIVSCLI